jgi:ATP-dependent Clp protease ATP-binding subunit ClpA
VFERFDQDALRAVLASQEAARELGAAEIGSDHVLIGLVSKEWFASAQVLTMLGAMSSEIREALGLPIPIEDRHRTGAHLPLDRSTKRIVKQSTKEAGGFRSDRIGTEHVLLALLRVGEGSGARVLAERGITHRTTSAAVTTLHANP